MKCTSSDVLASGQADNQLIEPCGCIFIIYYRLPDAFLHIVRHSRCQSLTYRLERISYTGCSVNRSKNIILGVWQPSKTIVLKLNLRHFWYAFLHLSLLLLLCCRNLHVSPKMNTIFSYIPHCSSFTSVLYPLREYCV